MIFLPLFILMVLTGAIILLGLLFVIDLKYFLLLDKYVFPFGVLGMVAHGAIGFTALSPLDMAFGALVGGGGLLAVRAIGTYYYKQEAMGLGDVKLLAAGGIWLGPEGTLLAITAGAVVGLIHGLGIATFVCLKNKSPFSIRRLVIPAGPGFIIGILFVFATQYFSFFWPIISPLFIGKGGV